MTLPIHMDLAQHHKNGLRARSLTSHILIYAMFFNVLFPFLLDVNVRVMCSHAWYHVYGYVLPRSTCLYALSMLPCSHAYIWVFTCLCAWIYVPYMLFAIFHVIVHSMPCAIVALLLLYLSFLCFGLLVRTMVFIIVHTPWPISKGLDHPFCMSMLACFYALCLC